MRKTFSNGICGIVFVFLLGTSASGYVFPQLGGGQVGQASAPMKHADISFDGVNLSVHVDPTVPIPVLRPLVPPDEFDPAMPWSVLTGKAHNFQYGWNPSGFWAPPVGTGIWIEQISASPELEVYFVDGLPASLPYNPIFGTGGSSPLWKWSGAMTHNAYAVLNPTQTSYEATYKVFIGNETTGEAAPGYGSSLITFEFRAMPVLTADFNSDGLVDGIDLSVWQDHYGMINSAQQESGDTDGDGDVDGQDFLNWQRQVSTPLTLSAAAPVGARKDCGTAFSSSSLRAIPEPTGISLVAVLFFVAATRMGSNERWGLTGCRL